MKNKRIHPTIKHISMAMVEQGLFMLPLDVSET